MDVQVPRDTARALTIRSNTSVNINTPDSTSLLRLQQLDVETDQGSIAFANVDFAEGEVVARSNAGSIVMDAVNLNTGGDSGLEKATSLYSMLGPISVTNTTLVDCDLHVVTGAGTIQMDGIDRFGESIQGASCCRCRPLNLCLFIIVCASSTATAGRSFINVKSSSGTITVNELRANWIVLANGQGDVVATSLVSEVRSSSLVVMVLHSDVTIRVFAGAGKLRVHGEAGGDGGLRRY